MRGRQSRVLIGALATGVLAFGCVDAHAGVARVDLVDSECSSHGCDSQSTSANYRADPGERNRLAVTRVAHGAVLFTDTAARVRVERGCRSIDLHRARCPGPQSEEVLVNLGDRADELVTAVCGYQLFASGGPGDDVMGGDALGGSQLAGDAGDDVLRAGRNAMTLIGGPGRDVLRGGPGDDELHGDGGAMHPFPDLLDGGGGRDTVSYQERTAPVTVDLEHPGDAGAPGEHDRLRSIEDIDGGAAPDVLRGDSGPNSLVGYQEFGDPDAAGVTLHFGDRLTGRGGNDDLQSADGRGVLDGGGGRDHLTSGAGDRVRAGPGDDLVELNGAARVACGPGRDLVSGATAAALVESDCDIVEIGNGYYRISPLVPAAGDPGQRILHLRATVFGFCRATLTATFRRGPSGKSTQTLGQVEIGRLRGGHLRQVRLRLTRAGRALASRPGRVRALLALRVRPTCASRFETAGAVSVRL